MKQKKQEYETAKLRVLSFAEDVVRTSSDGYALDIYESNTWVDGNIQSQN